MNTIVAEMKRFVQEESGIGVVELVLILVALVALIVIFKKQLKAIITNAFSGISEKANKLAGKEE